MKKLIAIHDILYLTTQYKVGQELPANNPIMVKAWIEAGTAVWQGDGETQKPAKAKPATAPAGRTGKAVPKTSEDDLVGKVPEKKK